MNKMTCKLVFFGLINLFLFVCGAFTCSAASVSNIEERSGWTHVYGGPGIINQTNGRLEDADSNWSYYYWAGGTFGAGVYQIQINLITNVSPNGPAFMWRANSFPNNTERGYLLMFDWNVPANGVGKVWLAHYLNGTATTLATCDHANRGPVTVRIEDDALNVKVYLDGSLAISVAAVSESPGYVGINGGWGAGNWFDDLTVSPASMPSGNWTAVSIPNCNVRPQDWFASMSAMPEGQMLFDGIPFQVGPGTGNNAFSFDDAFGATNPSTNDINIGMHGITQVQTIINTKWGQVGPASYARIDFIADDGTTYSKDLVGGTDIRDWNNNTWVNTVNGTTTENIWINGAGSQEVRIDKQNFDLPSGFQNKTLSKIRLIDFGHAAFQRMILFGLSVNPPAQITATVSNVNVSFSSYVPQNVRWSCGDVSAGGNPASIIGLAPGIQNIKAWQDGGTPFGEELWVETNILVGLGSQKMNFIRNLPYGELHIYKGAHEIGWGSAIKAGDQITAKMTVHNPGTVSQAALPVVKFGVDIGSPNYTHVFSPQTISPGGSKDFTWDFLINAEGRWRHTYGISNVVNGVMRLTDSEKWYPDFFVTKGRMTTSAAMGNFYFSPGNATQEDLPLGNRIPLILIHGSGNDENPLTLNYWQWWIDYMNASSVFTNKFKVYRFVYDTSDNVSMAGSQLAALTDSYPEFQGRHVVLLAHSMGGLVCRYALNSDSTFQSKVVKLLTLATPHLGSPGACPPWIGACALINGGVATAEIQFKPDVALFLKSAGNISSLIYEGWGDGFVGTKGEFDLAWYNKNDIPFLAYGITDVFTGWSFDYDLNRMQNSMSAPFTGSSLMVNGTTDKIIAFAGANPELSASGNSYQDTTGEAFKMGLNNHFWLRAATLAMASIFKGDLPVTYFNSNDGFVPLESALFNTHSVESYNLSSSLGKNLDHMSFLDDPDVFASVGNKLDQVAAQITGSLIVTIDPADAATAGAQWQVDGGAWHSTGDTVPGLGEGSHTVHFKTVSGWLTPADTAVNVTFAQTATLAASYGPTDHIGPQLTVSFSLNGNKTTASFVGINGTVSDASAGASGIAGVTVNDTPATGGQVSGNGSANWSFTGSLAMGTNTFVVVATDASVNYNTTTQTVIIVRGQGPSVSGLSDLIVLAGNSAVLNASVSGTAPLSYQWFKNGSPISGANNSMLQFNPVSRSDTANYKLTVSNEFDSLTTRQYKLIATTPVRMLQPQLVNTNVFRVEFEPVDGVAFTANDLSGYAVEASADLTAWNRLNTSLQVVGGRIRTDLLFLPSTASVYYRVVKP